jgi:hypothetical protein
MFRMSVGHSDDVDVNDALEEIFEKCDAGLSGETPKAGLLFAALENDHQAIVERVRTRYPDLELIGSSSAGEMSSILGYQEDSIVLALLASDRVDFTVGLGQNAYDDPKSAAVQAVAEARAKTDQEPRLCIVFPMPIPVPVDPAEVLRHLRDELGPDIPLLGGGAALEQFTFPPSPGYQYAGDVVTQGALPILLISGPISYSFGVDTGWRAVGPQGKVTKATEPLVQEIEGRPAIEFYERHLGPGKPAFANPLAVYEGSDQFYLRSPIDHDAETGAILFAAGVPEGSTVQLTVAATAEIFQGTKSAVTKAIEGYPQGMEPEAALLFSCAVRKLLLGTRTGTELELARNLLGDDVPVLGFYCFGEVAPIESPEVDRYHNVTIVAVLLGSR